MDPNFKFAFIGVSGFGVLLLVGMALSALLFKDPMTDAQKTFSIICSHGLFMCLGFMIGGGGATRLAA
jgi:hypothetical protein